MDTKDYLDVTKIKYNYIVYTMSKYHQFMREFNREKGYNSFYGSNKKDFQDAWERSKGASIEPRPAVQATTPIESQLDLSKFTAREFDKWMNNKMNGIGWTGRKDKFGNWFAWEISPFRTVLLVRPNGKLLNFRKESDMLTKEEDSIYSKIFDLILEKQQKAQANNVNLLDNFAENSRMFDFIRKTLGNN